MSAWSDANGAKGGQAKQSATDVESYFKINDVKKLVNLAVNEVAESCPDDFKGALAAAVQKSDPSNLQNSATGKKHHSKEAAEKAKAYLNSKNAEAILAEALGKLAVSMPPNPATALAQYIKEATGAAQAPAAPSPGGGDKGGKGGKKGGAKEEKEAAAPAATPAAAPAEKKKEKEGPPPGVDAKKWKVAVKEGGKKGIELSGAADLGGLEFFTTQMESAEGDLALLQCCMDAANKELDPNEEEQKGGSGEVGKLLLSSGDKQLALMSYVPKSKKDKCNASEWLKVVLESCNGTFVEGDGLNAKGLIKGDGETRFPLKDKDTCQAKSVEWLKSKDLFPQADQDDDDWVPPDDIEW